MTRTCTLILLISLLTASISLAEDGVTATGIRIGTTCDLSAGVKDLGVGMSTGVRVFFNRINTAGGINGRKFEFTAKDDGYDPVRALNNVKKMVETDKVFAILDEVGTPTTQATMPYLKAHQIPSIFAFTGGSMLYPQPPIKNYFQLRVSYEDEAASLVRFAVNDLHLKDIGVFYQDDAYGISGRASVDKTLASLKLKAHGTGTYVRNTVDVAKAVADLKKAKPQAIFMQAVTKSAIEFIKASAENGFTPVFLCPSPIGLTETKDSVASLPVDLYFSEVMPSPTDDKFALIRDFRKDMAAAHEAQVDFFSLEGYLGAAVFAEAVKRMDSYITRANLISTLESMNDVKIGGFSISFSPDHHVGLNRNFIFHLEAGKIKSIN